MGTIARLLSVAVVLAGTAVGTAAPSSADQVMEGIYTFNAEGSTPAEWTIYPLCTPTVGDLRERDATNPDRLGRRMSCVTRLAVPLNAGPPHAP